MSKNLVNLEIAALTARAALKAQGKRAGDLDAIVRQVSKGKQVQIIVAGKVVTGTVSWVANAGFRGIEAHVDTKAGKKVVRIDQVKIAA